MKPRNKFYLIGAASAAILMAFASTGYAAWIVGDSKNAGITASADANVLGLAEHLSFDHFSAPKIGKYFFQDESTQVSSKTGLFSFQFGLVAPNSSLASIVSNLCASMEYSTPGTDTVISSSLITKVECIQGANTSTIANPTYDSGTVSFDIPANLITPTSTDPIYINFTFDHALVYAHKQTILNGGQFELTVSLKEGL